MTKISKVEFLSEVDLVITILKQVNIHKKALSLHPNCRKQDIKMLKIVREILRFRATKMAIE